MPIDQLFAEDYAGAKIKFRAAAEAAGAALHAYEHPSQRGPSGEKLSIDVAVVGSPAATLRCDRRSRALFAMPSMWTPLIGGRRYMGGPPTSCAGRRECWGRPLSPIPVHKPVHNLRHVIQTSPQFSGLYSPD
jgi:hypothetical protein